MVPACRWTLAHTGYMLTGVPKSSRCTVWGLFMRISQLAACGHYECAQLMLKLVQVGPNEAFRMVRSTTASQHLSRGTNTSAQFTLAQDGCCVMLLTYSSPHGLHVHMLFGCMQHNRCSTGLDYMQLLISAHYPLCLEQCCHQNGGNYRHGGAQLQPDSGTMCHTTTVALRP